jgi:signal transduction histidine kinase
MKTLILSLSLTAALAGAAAREAGQRASLAALPEVTASIHPTALRRALRNVVENADRYAGGGTIGLRTDGDEAVLSVTDDGPGLPPGFDPLAAFSRGEGSRNRASGGSGLGLAIAARIAAAHGGRLAVVPKPSGGVVAAIRVPLHGVTGSAQSEPNARSSPKRPEVRDDPDESV